MKLTLAERRAIYRGETRALRRPQKPKVEAGQVYVLAWSRGGKQIVDYDTGATIDVPRKPTVWLEFKEPELRNGEWLIRYAVHDERELLRLLGATPGPPTEGGLKTRARKPESVPAKGEQVDPFTNETARGYSGSGRRAIDPLQAVDDEALAEFATVGRMRFAEHRAETEKLESENARRRRERAVRDRLRERIRGLQPQAQVELLAAIEREIEDAGKGEAA